MKLKFIHLKISNRNEKRLFIYRTIKRMLLFSALKFSDFDFPADIWAELVVTTGYLLRRLKKSSVGNQTHTRGLDWPKTQNETFQNS